MGRSNTRKRWMPRMGMVVIPALVLVMAGWHGGPAGAAGVAAPAEQAAPMGEAAPVAEAAVVEISASEFKFEPSQLELAAPGPLTVTLRNKGVIEHDFVIEGVEGHVVAGAGAAAEAVFALAAPGTYTVICSIPGHKEAGMRGILVVDDGPALPADQTPPVEEAAPGTEAAAEEEAGMEGALPADQTPPVEEAAPGTEAAAEEEAGMEGALPNASGS